MAPRTSPLGAPLAVGILAAQAYVQEYDFAVDDVIANPKAS
jgi:hypothetical protein